MIIEKITVYEDHIEIQLKADIDQLLRCGTIPEADPAWDAVAAMSQGESINFKQGTGHISQIAQSSQNRPDKVFRVSVISNGDPLEIFTDRDGSVIFKKYSLMDDQSEFAQQICEAVSRTTGGIIVVTDRDSVVASAGAPKRELAERRISDELGHVLEERQLYRPARGETGVPVCESDPRFTVAAAAPILSGGDLLGGVLYAAEGEETTAGEAECKLAQAMAAFLGRHMEH